MEYARTTAMRARSSSRGSVARSQAASRRMARRAAARVEELLQGGASAPLDPDVERAVRAVVDRAEATAGL